MKTYLKWFDRVRRFAHCYAESRTQQSHKDSSDVNHIVERFQRTGEMPPNPRGLEPLYLDVTHLQADLTEAYNNAVEAKERYELALENQERKQQQLEQEKTDLQREAQEEAARQGGEDVSPQPVDK